MSRFARAASILAIAAAAAYGPALNHGSVQFDDAELARGGSRVGGGSWRVWVERSGDDPVKAVKDFFATRQLRNAALAATESVFGWDPWGARFVNVLLHWITALAVYSAGAVLLATPEGALFAALVFTLHPLQTESVTYLAGLRDVLAGALGLWAFVIWVRAKSSPGRVLSAVLWVLSTAAKPSTLFLPILIAAWTAFGSRGRAARWQAAVSVAASAALAVLLAVHDAERGRLLRADLASLLWYGSSAPANWSVAPSILLHVYGLLAFPARLIADYSSGFWTAPASAASVLTCVAALAAIAATAWSLRVNRPVASGGVLWVVAAYAPMLPWVPSNHNLQLFAEHWLYLAVPGAAFVAADAYEAAARRRPRASLALAAAVVVALGARTVVRNADWKDGLTLWTKTTAQVPGNARAQALLAVSLRAAGRDDEAEAALRQAAALDPAAASNGLALASFLSDYGRFAEADRELARVWATPSGRLLNTQVLAYHRGLLSLRQGRLEEACRSFKWAGLTLGAPSWEVLGYCAYLHGRLEEAERLFRGAIERQESYFPALNDYALLELDRSRPAHALALLDRVLAEEPNHAFARANRARALTALGRYAQSHTDSSAALRLLPESAVVWRARAANLRAWGLGAAAVKAAQRAVSLDPGPESYGELLAASEALHAPRPKRHQ